MHYSCKKCYVIILNNYYNKFIDYNEKNNIITYSGSASSEHMPVLLEKFPTLKFILIDPNYHSVNWKSEYIYQNQIPKP